MIRTTAQHLTITGVYGDGAQETATRLEFLALEAELARHHTGTAPTPCTVTYHIPGFNIEQRTWTTSYKGMMEWVAAQVEEYLVRYGLTMDDLLKPGCPIRVAFGRIMPAGNVEAWGNWPQMVKGVPGTLAVYQIGLSGDEPEDDLEVVVFTRRIK